VVRDRAQNVNVPPVTSVRFLRTSAPDVYAAAEGSRWLWQLVHRGILSSTAPSVVAVDPGAAVHSWNTRNVPRRFALLAGFVMVGTWAKASTKCGFATKQAARQPLKRARARPISE